MSKKKLATDFMEMLMANKVREAYDKFVSSKFIHHNQYFKGDREALMLAMEESHKENPNTKIDFKHVLEDGDKVVTISHVRHTPEALGYAVVHVFKFEGDMIVELWDLGQEIPKDSPNENGIF